MTKAQIQVRRAGVEDAADVAARHLYEKLGFTNEEDPGGATMLFYEREI